MNFHIKSKLISW